MAAERSDSDDSGVSGVDSDVGDVGDRGDVGDVGDVGDRGEILVSRDADVAELADTSLRNTLEFAVLLAVEGKKLRPPLPFPAALKSFLRLQKLDKTSLPMVRRAVVADEKFRDRLALVANLDLVDELGIVWLQRHDGWQVRVLELQAAARAEAEAESAELALRRSERRREAAEQASARAQAQLLSQRDDIAREQARREKAATSAAVATAEAGAVRRELEQLQREVAKLRAALASETDRADRASADAAVASDLVRSLEVLRDQMLAQRAAAEQQHPERTEVVATAPAPGHAEAAHALRQAAAATRDLAEALASAAGALAVAPTTELTTTAQPPVKSGQRRAARRKPIAIPGGMYGDSVAAAVHLLRTPHVVTLVDGYNVAKLAWPHLVLIEQRECCIDALEELARRFGSDIRVIFDGADVVGASSRRRLIRVRYSPAGVIADDVIRAEVAALPPSTPLVVVTNDQAIAADVRPLGVNVLSSDALLAAAGRIVAK